MHQLLTSQERLQQLILKEDKFSFIVEEIVRLGNTLGLSEDSTQLAFDAKNYYKDWLIVSIKDYFTCNKWTYTAEMRYAWTEALLCESIL